MNPTLIAAVPGLMVGGGLAIALLVLAPRAVRAGDALVRLGEASVAPTISSPPLSQWDRIGSWLSQNLPQVKFLAPPTRDLDLLEIPVSRFFARKFQLAILGLFAPVVLSLLAQVFTGQPFPLPLLVSPVLALIMWMMPDGQVKARAAAARREFTRFVSVYLKLVAVALLGSTTADTALNDAASVSDTWVFRRIRREYARAELTRTTKWDAIERLGAQIEIPSLIELGRTMRLSEARVSLRDQLLATDQNLRTLVEAADEDAAKKITKRSGLPVYMTLFPVILIVLLPPIYSLFTI